MIVSRRSYLLSRPSHVIMAAAGGASSPRTDSDPAQEEAARRFKALIQRTGAKL